MTSPAAGLYYKSGCDVSIDNPYLRLEVTIYPALSQHAALSEALEGTRDVLMNAVPKGRESWLNGSNTAAGHSC